MTAAVHILCGPAGSGKTGRLLDLFRQRTRCAPGTTLWLPPTRRAVDAVRSRLLQDGAALWGARLCTFQDFVENIVRCNDPRTQELSGVQRRLLVEDVVAHLQQRRMLSRFDRVADTRGFMDGLLTLLAELQRGDVTPLSFARAAYRYGDKARQFARIYAAYQKELHRRQLIDVEARTRHACRLMAQGLRQPFETIRTVFVDDFNDFSPAQHEALRRLCEWIDELWIALPDEPGDQRAELFSRPRSTRLQLQRLPAECMFVERGANEDVPPSGLRHLERQLFRPLRQIEVSVDASGIECIEAPGMLGETRLVARRIKEMLLQGTAAEDVVVTMRDFGPYADLVREVFDEYGIPIEVEGVDPLTRSPAVAVLLRALRLPDDDWPFAGVTALLRNTFFRPNWPEVAQQPEMPQQAEALLRLLGEPRGRAAYLNAVMKWAEQQQPGLEDEQAQESRRRRIHDLAKTCAAFMQRFFTAWDGAPDKATAAEHLAWVKGFADDAGITRAAELPSERAAMALLWSEAEQWTRRHEGKIDRRTFHRRLAALASEAGLPRTPHGSGRVRVLSAPLARHIDAPFVFLMGLGERSFPRLTAQQPIFDEQERAAFQAAGIELNGSEIMADEMLLFYQIVTRARSRLVLSYPAVDERGQPLLPSSFLTAVLDCFRPNVVTKEQRRMLIERYDSDKPLSLAEYRVRVAALWKDFGKFDADLPADVKANLEDAADLIRLRFQEREFNSYDGVFRDPRVLGELKQLFGPEKVFSPTALEDYVMCPFRFLLKNVLRLEPLEEPKEGIEMTRRGQAFHRALARLHRKLKDEGVHQPADSVPQRMAEEIGLAVLEDVQRAPSPASKELWRLEGQRLIKLALRYGDQWQKFVKPWNEQQIAPAPSYFEVDYGLPGVGGQMPYGPLVIRDEEIEVRISGRIDRVDVAEIEGETVFWIIDYKTGRSANYTGVHLAEFRRLQLTLYALAAQQVLLADRNARPLGLAYWLVTESGPKVALPLRSPLLWLEQTRHWREVREQLQKWVLTLARNIRGGMFPLEPREEHCTQTCDFGQICRITQARGIEKTERLPLPTVESS
jgi:ATP-dependent helicase/nuclease subunit B